VAVSLVQRLERIEEALDGPGRYRDIALALRREKNGDTLLWAGGVWDRLEKRFLDPDSEREPEWVHEIYLEESQVAFTLWFAEFLADFAEGFPRDISAALLAGDRRAGKTFDAYYCQIAALIDVPIIPEKNLPAIGWTVSKTYRERDELDQLMAARIPKEWYKAQKAPEHRFDFIHGSYLRNLSEDDPDSLKQGKVHWLLYNEVQKMRVRGVVNGLYGTVDDAGLCMMTANKPREGDSRGEWLFDVKEAIEEENAKRAKKEKFEPLGIVHFGLSSKQNKKIDQPARKRVGKLVRKMDPAAADADEDDGIEWKRNRPVAFWEFDKKRHLRLTPTIGAVDVTRELAQRLVYGGDWDALGGIDIQSHPHIPAATIRCFGDPNRPIYWFVDEYVLVGRQLTEQQFIEGFDEKFEDRYTRKNFLWICDASSAWQGPKHDFEHGEQPSLDVFVADGWTMLPSRPPSKNSKTGRGSNPPVDERLQLINELLRQDRLFIDPVRCPWLAECAKEATTKKETGRRNLVGNKFAHMIDASTYPICRIEPLTKLPPTGDISSFGGLKGFSRNPYGRR